METLFRLNFVGRLFDFIEEYVRSFESLTLSTIGRNNRRKLFRKLFWFTNAKVFFDVQIKENWKAENCNF